MATPSAPTRILLGVTGGIAAYKSADLVRRLKERGADVHVWGTRASDSEYSAWVKVEEIP